MSGSNEWCEYHLTPRGWFKGNQKFDDGDLIRRITPTDVIITLTFSDCISFYAPLTQNVTKEKVNHNISEDELNKLYAKYGRVPDGYEEYLNKLS